MIEKVITRAVTYAISFAVVNAVTNAVTNATRNAVAKSLKNKLVHLGVDMDDPDAELIEQLIDVEVIKDSQYIVVVRENIFGVFETTYRAFNQEDAIKTLGKKMFGFVNVNKKVLKKEEADFFLGIWFETVMKDFFKKKITKYKDEIAKVEDYLKEAVEAIGSKSLLSQIKNREKEITKVKSKINEFSKYGDYHKDDIERESVYLDALLKQFEREKMMYEGSYEVEGRKNLDKLSKQLEIFTRSIENPEFICTADAVGVKGFEFSATKSNTKKEA